MCCVVLCCVCVCVCVCVVCTCVRACVRVYVLCCVVCVCVCVCVSVRGKACSLKEMNDLIKKRICVACVAMHCPADRLCSRFLVV